MSNNLRRGVRREPFGDSDSDAGLALAAQDVRSRDNNRDSTESDDNDEHIASAPSDIARQLNILQRQMVHNFRSLHDGLRDTNRRLDEQRADTNRRFDEQRADTNRRFDEHAERFGRLDERLGRLDVQLGQLKAHQMNQRATHINSPIQPVGLDDGTPIPIDLFMRYNYVHKFLRLKHRDNLRVLAALLRFYGTDSWSTWGLVSLSLGDESDEEEPLISHNSLEAAIDWAPEIALQELASCIGLEYDKIMMKVEDYESVRQERAKQKKRAINEGSQPSKRERLETPVRQKAHASKADRTKVSTPIRDQSEELEWDTRDTEDRTPESRRPRFKDASEHRQPTLSPTSVATSDAQLPTRTKR